MKVEWLGDEPVTSWSDALTITLPCLIAPIHHPINRDMVKSLISLSVCLAFALLRCFYLRGEQTYSLTTRNIISEEIRRPCSRHVTVPYKLSYYYYYYSYYYTHQNDIVNRIYLCFGKCGWSRNLMITENNTVKVLANRHNSNTSSDYKLTKNVRLQQ